MAKKPAKKVKNIAPREAFTDAINPFEQQALNAEIRLDNLRNRQSGKPGGSAFAVVKPKKNSQKFMEPTMIGWGDRSTPKMRAGLGFSDMVAGAKHLEDATFTSEELPTIAKKIRKKIEQETDYLNSYYGHYGTILPEYDMYESFTMVDTEAFLMQAINRKHALMFRQGFQVRGESDRFTKYVNLRLNQCMYMMNTTLENFIKQILWNLLIQSNCFILKIRDAEGSGGEANEKNANRIPVAGYMIIPPNSIFPFLNQKGEIIKWRRYYGSARKYKDYKIEDVIHFKWDVKPGHVYGTPRTVPVRDDIFALRRLEENVEMLLINHLYPLFHVKVGNEKAPAAFMVDGISEVDLIKAEIENMPKEGVFVTDERVEVDVVGIKGEAMDPKEIMEHYKRRIFTGLGVSPIDMGETDTGNRATAENVSQNLKDAVKADLNWFCGQFRMFIIRELFEENPSKLSVQNALLDVQLVFPDVDVDGHIKWENHVIEKFNNHLITLDEARRLIQQTPMSKTEEQGTHFNKHIFYLQQEGIKLKNKGMIEAMAVRGEVAAGKAKAPTASKANKGAKSVANKNRPANQHGRNTSPHSARSSMDPNLIYDLLMQERTKLSAQGNLNSRTWPKAGGSVIDKYIEGCLSNAPENYYTNQERMDLESFRQLAKDRVSLTTDPDILSVMLNDLIDQFDENIDGQDSDTESEASEPTAQRAEGASESDA